MVSVISCNFRAVKNIFSRALEEIRKDFLRTKVDRIFHKSLDDFKEKIPPFSEEEMGILSENLDEFLREHPEIFRQNLTAFISLLQLSLIAVYPRFNRESLQTLMTIILEVLEDHGEMFNRA